MEGFGIKAVFGRSFLKTHKKVLFEFGAPKKMIWQFILKI